VNLSNGYKIPISSWSSAVTRWGQHLLDVNSGTRWYLGT
jgi:hypothetical protein